MQSYSSTPAEVAAQALGIGGGERPVERARFGHSARPDGAVHIAEAARQLGVCAGHIRNLERDKKIPPARRDVFGRIYTPADIALLRALGVGKAPRKLVSIEELGRE